MRRTSMSARKTAPALSADARKHGVTLRGDSDGLHLHVPAGVRLSVPLCFDAAQVAALHVDVGRDAAVAVAVVAVPSVGRQSLAHRSTVAAGGSVHWQTFLLGGDVQHELVSTLQGGGARSTADVVFYARGTERQKISVRNAFRAGDGGGEITIKGVAEGKAHVACDGMIDIGADGRGTDTFLTEQVLMLDATARVDAVPGLEIHTNDVKASHSATVARVGAEDLFYFASRGIPERMARRMFVEGFLGDLLGRVADDKFRRHVTGLIGEKYDQVNAA